MQNDLSLILFFEKFPDEQSCRKYLETRLWKNGCVCPHCGNDDKNNNYKIYKYKNGRLFKCSKCSKQFQITTNTIYENSNLSLHKWFLAMYLIGSHKKGLSSIQLSKSLGITQKSAWYLAHKIRYMLQYNTIIKPLKGIVECDETYIGGKMKGKRGRGSTNKTPVFGMLQRNGKLIITPVPDTKRKTIEPIIHANVLKGTKIMTDEWHAYKKLEGKYKHQTVNHGKKEYVRGIVHVNGLEGAWSIFKGSLRGIYHRPSKQHLAKYCAEFQFKYNTRNDSEKSRFDKVIGKTKMKVKPADIF